MNDIYDISSNITNNLFDLKINLLYFAWVLLVFLIYILFFKKKNTIKVDKNWLIIKNYKQRLKKFDENYLNYDIQKFYDELNKILLLSLKIYIDPEIKDINNKEIEHLDVDLFFKEQLKHFYIHQFESNFDTADYRELVYSELKEIIKILEK